MTELERIRAVWEQACEAAEDQGAAPEGIATIAAERIRYEAEQAERRVIDENTGKAA